MKCSGGQLGGRGRSMASDATLASTQEQTNRNKENTLQSSSPTFSIAQIRRPMVLQTLNMLKTRCKSTLQTSHM